MTQTRQSQKAMFAVLKKNVFTKGKWVEVDRFNSLAMADAKAEFIKNTGTFAQKKRDTFGGKRPDIKTQTKIVRLGK